jgi:CRISPR-associated endonuclease/helicase Cas3
MTALPSFEAVYEAAYPGRSPFPWQRRLVGEILADQWPSVLDLPTGVGKTSALDIALYCLAAAPERMPRRIVLVVDRRIVVDQGAVHARELQRKMTQATDGPLAVIAERLRGLWGASNEPPFAVAVMRGGVPRDNDWARRPDQPVLGVSTVDQLGSRLLFRGYGVRPLSAPIHAGLIGNDTLILLDEVHLANAFAQTLDSIRTRFRGTGARLPQRFAITQMSATRRSTEAAPRIFELDGDDRADPTLVKRLGASKRAMLRTVKVAGDSEPKKLELVAARAVQEAIALQAGGARVVAIVVNRVDTARIASRLLERHQTTDAALITGRMRPIERDHIVQTRLVPRAGASRTRTPDERPLVVVATQCIEAGADLDFDAIVTECASLDALRQRFGRVDRRGDLGTSDSVILCRSDQIAEASTDPIYGESLGATWRWLIEHAIDDRIDLGISKLPVASDPAGRPRTDLLPPVAEVPVLLPTHLDIWAQTSQSVVADPDVALWLHGNVKPGADVQLIWRADADVASLDEQQLERLVERLQACRPSALEAVTAPLATVRRWLDGESPELLDSMADVEGDAAVADQKPGRKVSRQGSRVLRWTGDDSELVWPHQLRPGDVLVLDAARGGIWQSSFAPESREPVVDLGDLAQLRGRGIATMRLERGALGAWQLPVAMLDTVPGRRSEDEPPEEMNERIEDWLAAWPELKPERFIGTDVEWREARSALRSSRRRVTLVGDQLIITKRTKLTAEVDDAVTEDDDSSFQTAQVTLTAHSTDVRDLAERYARSLGFDDALVNDLALAAWLHDVGKADPRFQRWLLGGSEVDTALGAELFAKSALPPGNARARRLARERAGYPAGGRHELLSLAMVQHADTVLDTARDRDLVLHLVASHHGWCRPFPPPVVDPQDLEVRIHHGEHELIATTRHEFARLDSDVAPRFWRLVARYGWWGLAWLEAVIRLADHRASARATAYTQDQVEGDAT